METQRLLLYMAFGFISLILYQTWMLDYHTPQPAQGQQPSASGTAVPGPGNTALDIPDASGSVPIASVPAVQVDATVNTPSVDVSTDVLNIGISTIGATIVFAELKEYPVSLKRQNEPFVLMSNDPGRYLVGQSGLLNANPEQVDAAGNPSPVPNHEMQMSTTESSFTLEEGQDEIKVPFVWQSDNGITVTKTLTFRRGSYEVDVDYLIDNGSDAPWAVSHYRQLKRKPGTKDEKQQFVNTYIGAVVSTPEDRYQKYDFGDMEDERLNLPVTNGWIAMIQHYFATAWVPQQDEINTAYSRYLPSENRYLIGLISNGQSIAAGTQHTFSTTAYIGPKIQEKLKAVAPNLELTVDYGWLTILAQPLFWLLKTIHGFVGNWGWAIILVTCVIKAIFYKLSEASYRSMAKMKKLQPKLQELKERYGDDRAKMGQATMELYKKEKANPLGGCLPMLIQIPVFIALYWTLLESVELRQAPWMFHIKDLAIRDPYFILPVLMSVTMYIQQKLNPAPVDPIQAKVFQFLPLIFGVFFAMFPAGLVLYWVVNNTLTIIQQYYITRKVLGDDFSLTSKE